MLLYPGWGKRHGVTLGYCVVRFIDALTLVLVLALHAKRCAELYSRSIVLLADACSFKFSAPVDSDNCIVQ